jgi:hypothetical protein
VAKLKRLKLVQNIRELQIHSSHETPCPLYVWTLNNTGFSKQSSLKTSREPGFVPLIRRGYAGLLGTLHYWPLPGPMRKIPGRNMSKVKEMDTGLGYF